MEDKREKERKRGQIKERKRGTIKKRKAGLVHENDMALKRWLGSGR